MISFHGIAARCVPALVAALLAACADAPPLGPRPDKEEEWRHGDVTLAREARRIFASEKWRETAAEDPWKDKLITARLFSVWVPAEARDQENLVQRGFVRFLATPDGSQSVIHFLDSQWQIIAFMDSEGSLKIPQNKRLVDMAKHSVDDACKLLYHAKFYFAMDSYAYDNTTVLKHLPDADAETRGMVVKKKEKLIKAPEMCDNELARNLHNLEKDMFYKHEAERQRQFRRERVGEWEDQNQAKHEYSPYDDRKIGEAEERGPDFSSKKDPAPVNGIEQKPPSYGDSTERDLTHGGE